MTVQTRKFAEQRTVVLDASGTGLIRFGPQRPNTRFLIRIVRVKTSTAVLVPQAEVFKGTVSVSDTRTGDSDVDSEMDMELWPGEECRVVWTNGDVGAIATASFQGDELYGID